MESLSNTSQHKKMLFKHLLKNIRTKNIFVENILKKIRKLDGTPNISPQYC